MVFAIFLKQYNNNSQIKIVLIYHFVYTTTSIPFESWTQNNVDWIGICFVCDGQKWRYQILKEEWRKEKRKAWVWSFRMRLGEEKIWRVRGLIGPFRMSARCSTWGLNEYIWLLINHCFCWEMKSWSLRIA